MTEMVKDIIEVQLCTIERLYGAGWRSAYFQYVCFTASSIAMMETEGEVHPYSDRFLEDFISSRKLQDPPMTSLELSQEMRISNLELDRRLLLRDEAAIADMGFIARLIFAFTGTRNLHYKGSKKYYANSRSKGISA